MAFRTQPQRQPQPQPQRRQRAQHQQQPRESKSAQKDKLKKEQQERKRKYTIRLEELKVSFQGEIKKLENKRYLSIQAQNDIREIKENLKNETWWHVSEASELTGIVAANINMHCDLIFNLLEVAPGGKLAKIALDVTKAVLESAIKQESLSYDLILNVLNETAILEKYTYGKVLISLTLAFKSYGENLAKMVKLPAERKALKLEVQRQLIRIEAEMYRYRMEIQKSNDLINAKEYIIEQIDKEIENITRTF